MSHSESRILRRLRYEFPPLASSHSPVSSNFIRDFAFSVAVGVILLLLLSRLIGRVQFSLSTAFWCSFIGHTLLSIIAFLMGAVFAWQPAIVAVIVAVP